MKIYRATFIFIFTAITTLTQAQSLLETHKPEGQNVRLAWAIDLDGGVNGDEANGVEVTYASELYPLDQALISFTHNWPDGNAKHSLLLGIEEFYPIAEFIDLYGVAGVGYMWTDFNEDTNGSSTGWFGKVGAGILYVLNDRFDLYAEVGYYFSDSNLWFDGDDAEDSTNMSGLLGFRFKY